MKVKVLGVVNISYQNDIDIVKNFLNIDNIVSGPKFSISPSSRESIIILWYNTFCSNEKIIAFAQLDYYGTCKTHFLWQGLVSHPFLVYSNIYGFTGQID